MCQPCYQEDSFQTKPTSNKKLRIGNMNLICSKDAFHLSDSAKTIQVGMNYISYISKVFHLVKIVLRNFHISMDPRT